MEVVNRTNNNADPYRLDPFGHDESPVSPLEETFLWPIPTLPRRPSKENEKKDDKFEASQRDSYICRHCGCYNGISSKHSPSPTTPPSPPPPPPPPKSPPRQQRRLYQQQEQVSQNIQQSPLPPRPPPPPPRQSRYYAPLPQLPVSARHTTYIPYRPLVDQCLNGSEVALFSQSTLHLVSDDQNTPVRSATASSENWHQGVPMRRKLVKRQKEEQYEIPRSRETRNSVTFLGGFSKIFGPRRDTEQSRGFL
ncbi:hypothetical protein PRK78_000350 [Emydomyces testavorans]|uniref:Uncharacterized protein n=1 Tax=Emydomyces testavorans TaxID=2070801 RepID=A0AAF0DAW2_9EURO|nr:hypothetical protein PRK78_000350 [Emydomyces testavorans]